MNIMITNDDGIESAGIFALANVLSTHHQVLVLAPSAEKSACSHSITIHCPLILEKRDNFPCEAYSLNGSPADCVKFQMLYRREFIPDLILSGINRGENLGRDVLYSGTVGAAMEGCIMGVHSIAISSTARENNTFDFCASWIDQNLDKLATLDFVNTVYNINIPNLAPQDILDPVFVPLGRHTFDDHYVRNEDGHFYLTGAPVGLDKEYEENDISYNRLHHITITPLLCNRTHFTLLEKTGKLFNK